MLCLKNSTEHLLELPSFLNLVTAGKIFGRKLVLTIDRGQNKSASPYKDWPDLYTNPKLSVDSIPQNMGFLAAIFLVFVLFRV
jgi:hypothetical protein